MQAIYSEIVRQGNQPPSLGWPETARQAGAGMDALCKEERNVSGML